MSNATITVAATVRGKMFKRKNRKYRFKRVKLACHDQNRFKRELVVFRRFSLKSNYSEESRSHHTHQQASTHTHTAADTMPCAAGSRCQAVPDHTPGPPDFTNHRSRGVCGQYLHGNCGVVDPCGTRNTLTNARDLYPRVVTRNVTSFPARVRTKSVPRA